VTTLGQTASEKIEALMAGEDPLVKALVLEGIRQALLGLSTEGISVRLRQSLAKMVAAQMEARDESPAD
jgi:hypothetical protein